MKIDEKFIDRLNNLIKFGNDILIQVSHDDYGGGWVNEQNAFQFATASLNLIKQICGVESVYFHTFEMGFTELKKEGYYRKLEKLIGVLQAAKDDYENDYLFETRALIEGEVFDDFLEQSEHLLNQGYFTAAAVIAGSVLEDGLRKLCAKNGITLSAKPKLDTMNADLAKAGVYNLLKQKQITALAHLRNKAAHGLGGFIKEDVESMIKDVRRFMEDYFG